MSFFESGDQRICGRRGCGRCSSLGRGSVSPYDQYCAPSVVNCVESPPPRGRTYTLYLETKASSFLSGESTYGVSLGSVSWTAQRYDPISHKNRFLFAVNSISR